MNTSRDPIAMLTELRPDTLDAEWDDAARRRLLDQLLNDAVPLNDTATLRWRPRLPRRRRTLITAGVIAAGTAAAVIAGVLAPAGKPGGPDPAAAAVVERLAVVAGARGPAVGPGQYAYTAMANEQTADPGVPVAPGDVRVGDVDRSTSEQWLAPSGALWVHHGNASCVEAEGAIDANAADGNYADLSSPQLATLPTDASGLAAYLDAHPTGDNRGSRNRFLAVIDLVYSGLATPALRAAALQVLAQTDGIDVTPDARDAHNRPAIAVSRDDGNGFTDMVYFDPQTSYVLEMRTVKDNSSWHFTGVVTTSSAVDHLPDLPTCPSGGSGG